MGKNPKIIEPLVPGRSHHRPLGADRPLRHARRAATRTWRSSSSATASATQFLKWSTQAFKTFEIIPPGNGICHQVNLEYSRARRGTKGDMCLSRQPRRHRLAHDDGQRPRRAGLGRRRHRGRSRHARPADVLPRARRRRRAPDGRACATASPRPISCSRSPSCCARARSSASSSSSSAKAPRSLPLPDRATIGNMAPEYGATCGFFPVDDKTMRVPRRRPAAATSRSPPVKAYYKAQGMYGMPKKGEIDYSEVVELDLGTVTPAVAGPRRPHDRIDLPAAQGEVRGADRRSRSPTAATARRTATLRPALPDRQRRTSTSATATC